jgi:hypothetical protein
MTPSYVRVKQVLAGFRRDGVNADGVSMRPHFHAGKHHGAVPRRHSLRRC